MFVSLTIFSNSNIHIALPFISKAWMKSGIKNMYLELSQKLWVIFLNKIYLETGL